MYLFVNVCAFPKSLFYPCRCTWIFPCDILFISNQKREDCTLLCRCSLTRFCLMHILEVRKYLSQQCIIFFLCISFLRTGKVPYALRFPEDFLACSLVMQAVIGHEDRLVFWGESVFWVHARNQNVDNSGRV